MTSHITQFYIPTVEEKVASILNGGHSRAVMLKQCKAALHEIDDTTRAINALHESARLYRVAIEACATMLAAINDAAVASQATGRESEEEG